MMTRGSISMFLFYSNAAGIAGSIIVSVLLSLVLLRVLRSMITLICLAREVVRVSFTREGTSTIVQMATGGFSARTRRGCWWCLTTRTALLVDGCPKLELTSFWTAASQACGHQ
jgi:hypothetical protein